MVLTWLDNLPRFSKLNYNLYRTWLLLSKVVPQYRDFPVFFITGSKGKGTVAASLAAILTCAGYKTGRITSPHLIDITERINFNGADISHPELKDSLERVKTSLPQLPQRYGEWIHSEVLNAAALLYFKEKGADYLVIEAGLGGRLDSGNIFRRPVATCITTVAMEHVGILGNNIGEIAAEKAGIIKRETPLVTSAENEALDVIKKRSKLFEAPLFTYGDDFSWHQGKMQLPGRQMEVDTIETKVGRINKVMAATLANFVRVSDDAILKGLSSHGLPGRFEVYGGAPTFVLDVAHTLESVDNLVHGLNAKFPGKRIAFVVGFLSDKPVKSIMNLLQKEYSRVYIAPVEDVRSFNPQGISGKVFGKITDAICHAQQDADVVCVTGSFAAVREARILLSKTR